MNIFTFLKHRTAKLLKAATAEAKAAVTATILSPMADVAGNVPVNVTLKDGFTATQAAAWLQASGYSEVAKLFAAVEAAKYEAFIDMGAAVPVPAERLYRAHLYTPEQGVIGTAIRPYGKGEVWVLETLVAADGTAIPHLEEVEPDKRKSGVDTARVGIRRAASASRYEWAALTDSEKAKAIAAKAKADAKAKAAKAKAEDAKA